MKHRSAVSGVEVFADSTRMLTWSEEVTAQVWADNTARTWQLPLFNK